MRTPQKLSGRTMDDLLSHPAGSYLPDLVKGTVLVAMVVVTLRMYPMRTSAFLSVVARRIRFTPAKHHTHVSFDGIPFEVLSIRIPHRRKR